jgi:SOS response regulatory protein OraA/RecX
MSPNPDSRGDSGGGVGEITALVAIPPKGRRAASEPRWRVELDGEAWVELEAETVVRFGLKLGRRLGPDERQGVLVADQVLLARRWAAARCAARPRTRRALARELGAKRFTPAVIEEALKALEASGTLNDAEVARRHVRKRARAGGYGPARLLSELIEMGVERAVAEAVLAEAIGGEEAREACLEAARGWAARRGAPGDAKQRMRLVQFLQRRGFDGEAIGEALERIGASDASQ